MIPFNKIKNNLREKIYYQLCELEDKGYLKTSIFINGIKNIRTKKAIYVKDNVRAKATIGYVLNIYCGNRVLNVRSLYSVIEYPSFHNYFQINYNSSSLYVYLIDEKNIPRMYDYVYLNDGDIKYNYRKIGLFLPHLFKIPYYYDNNYYDIYQELKRYIGIHPEFDEFKNTKLSNSIYILSSLLITLIYNHLEYDSKTISIKECLIYN